MSKGLGMCTQWFALLQDSRFGIPLHHIPHPCAGKECLSHSFMRRSRLTSFFHGEWMAITPEDCVLRSK